MWALKLAPYSGLGLRGQVPHAPVPLGHQPPSPCPIAFQPSPKSRGLVPINPGEDWNPRSGTTSSFTHPQLPLPLLSVTLTATHALTPVTSRSSCTLFVGAPTPMPVILLLRSQSNVQSLLLQVSLTHVWAPHITPHTLPFCAHVLHIYVPCTLASLRHTCLCIKHLCFC